MSRNFNLINNSIVGNALKKAAVMVAMGLSIPAFGGGFGLDIHIGDNRPRREVREEVVIVERPVTYETYVVGYRRDLYDADLRLRVARADEWEAKQDLDKARGFEGEIAVELDEKQEVIGALRRRVGSSDLSAAEIRERLGGNIAKAEDLRKQLAALDHRINGAREDYDAARILHDENGKADASDRIKANEIRSAKTALELKETEGRIVLLKEEEAVAGARQGHEIIIVLRHQLGARGQGCHLAVAGVQQAGLEKRLPVMKVSRQMTGPLAFTCIQINIRS